MWLWGIWAYGSMRCRIPCAYFFQIWIGVLIHCLCYCGYNCFYLCYDCFNYNMGAHFICHEFIMRPDGWDWREMLCSWDYIFPWYLIRSLIGEVEEINELMVRDWGLRVSWRRGPETIWWCDGLVEKVDLNCPLSLVRDCPWDDDSCQLTFGG